MDGLVSCIMPTRDRPRFVRQALRCFLRQTRAESELIAVDDGEQPVDGLCAGLERVRYLRLDQPATIGAKLNLGIRAARGGIIQKLDDDDYYSPGFLDMAASRLPGDGCVVAWERFLVLFAGEAGPRDSGAGWTAGGTLCFTRELWNRRPFRDLTRGEDSGFMRDHRPRIVRVNEPDHYMMVRHGENTWTRMSDGATADGFLRSLPVYGKPLRTLLNPADCEFYESLESPVIAARADPCGPEPALR